MRRFFGSLFGQVVAALVLGIVLGMVWPGFAVALKPLGDAFIKLIKMVVAPLVFGVVVHGIVGAADLDLTEDDVRSLNASAGSS